VKPRADCDTDELWMPPSQGFVTMEVLSEGAKAPLGFDLRTAKMKRRDERKSHAKVRKGK